MVDYADLAPYYIVGSSFSVFGTSILLAIMRFVGRLEFKTVSARFILALILVDLLYAAKFFVSAAVWYAGHGKGRDSFHFIPDNCLSSVLYEHVVGMLSICMNAVRVVRAALRRDV